METFAARGDREPKTERMRRDHHLDRMDVAITT